MEPVHPSHYDGNEFVGNCYQCECNLYLYNCKLHKGKRYCRSCIKDDYAISKENIKKAMVAAVDALKGLK